MVTGTFDHCSNQNCWFLNACASTYIGPLTAGDFALMVTVTLAPGATSEGSTYDWLVRQLEILAEPPGSLVKRRFRFTGLRPPEGHGCAPCLASVTGNDRVWV